MWGVEQGSLPAEARQQLAVRHASLVRSIAIAMVREGGVSRSQAEVLMGAGVQALILALRTSRTPSGPGFERYAQAQIRKAMEVASMRTRTERPKKSGNSEQT
jgi:DNA-directed RNA polymerase specialized sigma subunit